MEHPPGEEESEKAEKDKDTEKAEKDKDTEKADKGSEIPNEKLESAMNNVQEILGNDFFEKIGIDIENLDNIGKDLRESILDMSRELTEIVETYQDEKEKIITSIKEELDSIYGEEERMSAINSVQAEISELSQEMKQKQQDDTGSTDSQGGSSSNDPKSSGENGEGESEGGKGEESSESSGEGDKEGNENFLHKAGLETLGDARALFKEKGPIAGITYFFNKGFNGNLFNRTEGKEGTNKHDVSNLGEITGIEDAPENLHEIIKNTIYDNFYGSPEEEEWFKESVNIPQQSEDKLIKEIGNDLNIDINVIKSITQLESTSYADARFEYEKFQEQKSKTSTTEEAILLSTSFGRFQIMGFNHNKVGYDSVGEMVESMRKPEKQYDAFKEFIKNTPGLLEAMQNKEWDKIAKKYNGKDYERNEYSQNLKDNYDRITQESRVA